MKSTNNIKFEYMFHIQEGIERFLPQTNELKWQ
jgi:hypothetical protein